MKDSKDFRRVSKKLRDCVKVLKCYYEDRHDRPLSLEFAEDAYNFFIAENAGNEDNHILKKLS